LENITSQPKRVYNILKRWMDVLVSLALGCVSLIVYPFVVLAIRMESKGSPFSHQTRVGQNNKPVTLLKFRTMLFDDNGKWNEEGKENEVTKVGSFLRKTRIDELPQLWNVLKGDVSLVGPRPEFSEPVEHYNTEIPYYNVRHLIKPGLSGWAQMYHDNDPHHGTDVVETANKLSYDLYYLKNRSFLLDLKIAIKTLKTLVSIKGV